MRSRFNDKIELILKVEGINGTINIVKGSNKTLHYVKD